MPTGKMVCAKGFLQEWWYGKKVHWNASYFLIEPAVSLPVLFKTHLTVVLNMSLEVD